MYVRIEDADLSYEIPITHKVMMLTGMSASGKSTLFDVLARARVDAVSDTSRLRKILGLNSTTDSYRSLVGGYDVYIIDTDFVKLDNAFCKAISGANARFVLCGRAATSGIPIHYKAVLQFPRESGKRQRAVAVYAGIQSSLNPNLMTITEDSGAGRDFFRSYFKHLGSGATVGGAGGYARIPSLVNLLRSNGTQELQIVADAATFGNIVGDLYGLDGLHFFLPECVEQLFLACPMFDQSYRQKVFPLDLFSSERFFVDELRRQLLPTHRKYKKGFMHGCLAYPCAACRRGEEGLCSLRNDYKRPESIWEALEGRTQFSKIDLPAVRGRAFTQAKIPVSDSASVQTQAHRRPAQRRPATTQYVLSASQRGFLERGAQNVTVAQYAKVHKLTSDAARRELNALVLRGLAVCDTQSRPYKYMAVRHR